ncbi:MAG: hypothetical protein M3O88_01630 [Actinomycetota bacterium]|nr:hypothetical protein [Actinomycetota bacterium]
MTESVILVCDVCGAPAEEGVIIRIGGRNLAKDLCGSHLRELISGARTPKRGRRPGSSTRRGPGRPKGSTTAKSSAKRPANNGGGKTRRTKRTSAKRAA